MERSIYSAKYCFVEKMARDGIMPQPSAAVLNEWFKWATENVQVSVDCIGKDIYVAQWQILQIIDSVIDEIFLLVYLRTSPEIVYERILKRNREEERTVSLEYLQSLHEMHEIWLYHKTMFSCPAPVLVLNADLDKSVIKEEYAKYEDNILNKIPLMSIA